MKRKGITTYTLLKQYSFSRGTLDSLKQGRNISTATLNDLCNMLDCRVEDVLVYLPNHPKGAVSFMCYVFFLHTATSMGVFRSWAW